MYASVEDTWVYAFLAYTPGNKAGKKKTQQPKKDTLIQAKSSGYFQMPLPGQQLSSIF